MKRLALFSSALFLTGLASAGPGTTGAASLKLGAGAHGLALGEAYSAMADGAEALFWNPAGLVSGADRSLMLGFEPLLSDASLSQAAAAGRFGRVGLGLGFSGLKYDNLDSIDEVGNKTGSFSAQDQTFLAGAAMGGPRFSGGVSAKYWRSEIDGQSAAVMAADLGVGFQSPFSSRMRHAIVVRHLGGKVSYVNQQDPLPTTMVLGNSLKIGNALSLGLDGSWERAAGAYVAGGAEWAVVHSPSAGLALRSGYTTRRSRTGGLSGASFGLGIAVKSISFDYAWLPFGELGDSHMFTLVWRPNMNDDAPRVRHSWRKHPAEAPAAKGKIESRPSGRRQLEDLDHPHH